MTVPEDFQPGLKPGSAPAVKPTELLKRDIYKDASIFKFVDQHAISESMIAYTSFRDFIWNLLFKEQFNDIEKARIIFRWLTAKNLNEICFDEDEKDPAARFMNDFKNGKGSYARLFEYLARYSGLQAVSITGWAKGSEYKTSSALTSMPANHSWNAIYVNDSWQLIDSHWAAKQLLDGDGRPSGFKDIEAYDDFYFLTEPGEMIYSHLPEDSKWQLLVDPWTNAMFEDRPHARSHFFHLGLDLLGLKTGVLRTTKGVLAFSLGYSSPTSFTYKISMGKKGEDKVEGVGLSRYVLQEMTEDRVNYYVRCPRPDTYALTVFARPAEGSKQKTMVFKSVCDFKIISDEASKLKAFPFCSDASWGMDAYIYQYPMEPALKQGILLCPEGQGEVSFVKDPKIKIYARLVCSGYKFEVLKKCLSIEGGSGGEGLKKVKVGVSLPGEGEYGLEIFANNKSEDGELYSHYCQYLCSSLPPFNQAAIYGEIVNTISEDDETDLVQVEYKPHDDTIYTAKVDLKPPKNFTPAPLTESSDRPPTSYAAPRQFASIDVFRHVDNHARQVAKEPHGSFRELIWHLIYVRGITNELDKLRAVFVYLCSMDLRQLKFKDVKKDSPEELLVKLQKGETTYARVFEALCSYAGLQCHAVGGVAKGAEYQPGMKFEGDQGQHSWNVVKVNDTWQLIDCNWAARRLVGKEQSSGDNVHYELDEYYFLPPPEQLIYTHFPNDAIWQLIRNPISLEEFEKLALVKSTFFKFGLKIKSHKEAVIRCKEKVNVMIGCPAGKAHQLRFTFKLMHEQYGNELNSTELSQFGMQHMDGNMCVFTIRFPVTGFYRLVMFVKDASAPTDGEAVFSGVGEYDIDCEEPQENPMPFPPCAHTSWGPGDSFGHYRLQLKHISPLVYMNDGRAELRVKAEDELRFTAKLKAVGCKETELAPFLLTRTVDKEAIFLVHAPCAGEFGLEVYANNPKVDGSTLHHVYQYLLVCGEPPSFVEPFPVLPSGYLGPQPMFKDLGLNVSGQLDPYMTVDSGETSVSFVMSQLLRMSSQLIYCNPQGEQEECSEYVLQQSQDNLVCFLLKLCKIGTYKFQVYALPYDAESESLPGVYNCLINCRNTVVDTLPFPKQYAPWKDGCYLFDPLDGHLQPNRPMQGSASSYNHVFFRLEVPRATSVMVVVGEDWFPLDEKQPGQWMGEVLMEEYWGKERRATVCVSYEDPADSYGSLLEYSM